jgi:hypothetical protein
MPSCRTLVLVPPAWPASDPILIFPLVISKLGEPVLRKGYQRLCGTSVDAGVWGSQYATDLKDYDLEEKVIELMRVCSLQFSSLADLAVDLDMLCRS